MSLFYYQDSNIKSSDFGLILAIYSYGYTADEITKEDDGRVVFTFKPSRKIEKIVKLQALGKVLLPIGQVLSLNKMLRDLIATYKRNES